MSARTKAEEAAALALAWAADDSHGYDQAGRWGPDYDCSSFVISVWDAVGVPVKAAGATYTGNMRRAFKACGFAEVSADMGLRAGDVLLNETHHTALYVGSGQIVHAAGNEWGGATGGRTGDQTGREICVRSYYVPSYGWDCVLRYEGDTVQPEPETPPQAPTGPQTGDYRPGDRYMVQVGDSLWGIAERFLGEGRRWLDLYEYNRLSTTIVRPGDVIQLPPEDWTPEGGSSSGATHPAPGSDAGAELPSVANGDTGQAVQALQWLLMRAGYPLPQYGADGDFGPETEAALRAYQAAQGLTVTGTATPATWVTLIQG